MAKASISYSECLEQASKYESMGFTAQAEVWRQQALRMKKEEGEKRLRLWKRKMSARLEGGVSITEWLEWAFSQYQVSEVDSTFTVSSSCSPKSWTFDYEAEALEKVAQLVGWKEVDRKRGRGCMMEDLMIR